MIIKNKYQIALDKVRQSTTILLHDKESVDTLQELIDREKEIEAIANDCNELIDKSMPKKFKKINKYEYECPNCKELYDLNDVNYNYCPNCSQRIDWSEWI